jgi:hypothetical protein
LARAALGEVYRARDPRMRRDVAIKISAERFSDRFERGPGRRGAESPKYLPDL